MTTWPELRDELDLHPAPPAADGAPAWTLADPARNRFFHLPWLVAEILARWHLGSAERIAQAVVGETTLRPSADDVAMVGRFLVDNQLVRADTPRDSERLGAMAAAARTSWTTMLLHHYLFFRVPLLRPDRFLGATAGAAGLAFSRTFLWLSAVALAAGLVLAGRQWDRFLATFVDLMSWQGLAWYGLAYAAVKTIHEVGHAYAAKRQGARVPTMGIAFLVLWPVLYTDTNETWKLAARGQRRAVAAAGVAAELIVAAWATLAWSLLPEGPGRTVCFLLATTTWVSSLLINLSPFMRLDGYFLLADHLNLPNLHERSFALARWWLREWLFGLGAPPPEYFGRGRAGLLIAFAFITWVYRLILFLAIAALVYRFFFKAAGLFLFAVEIGWFVVRPVWAELGEWLRRRQAIAASPSKRKYAGLALLVVALVLLAVPWRGAVVAPGLLMAGAYATLYAPAAGMVAELEGRNGQTVAAGETLVRLTSPDLDRRLGRVETRIATLRAEIEAASVAASRLQRGEPLAEALSGALAERAGLLTVKSRLALAAPHAGTVVGLADDLASGQWVAGDEPLLSVRGDSPPRIEAFVDEVDLHRVAVGAAARFVADDPERPALHLRVAAIETTAAAVIDLPHLASVHGGGVPARFSDRSLVPERAVYRLRLEAVEEAGRIARETRGVVRIEAPPESLLAGLWRSLAALVLRESGV